MSADRAPEAPLVCICSCGNRAFYAFPDGANSYLLECPSCGKRSEISAGRGMTLTLVEVSDEEAAAEITES